MPELVPLCEHAYPRARHVGAVVTEQEEVIEVAHLFTNETCAEHGHLSNPGHVGIAFDGDDEGAHFYVLDPAMALLLADRLTRTANLALEAGEDVADVEREVIRHNGGSLDVDDDDPYLTDLRCPHGDKVHIPIEAGTWEVSLCPVSSTAPECYPQFRSVADFGAPSPFVLGKRYGGTGDKQEGQIIWDLTLEDIRQLP